MMIEQIPAPVAPERFTRLRNIFFIISVIMAAISIWSAFHFYPGEIQRAPDIFTRVGLIIGRCAGAIAMGLAVYWLLLGPVLVCSWVLRKVRW